MSRLLTDEEIIWANRELWGDKTCKEVPAGDREIADYASETAYEQALKDVGEYLFSNRLTHRSAYFFLTRASEPLKQGRMP